MAYKDLLKKRATIARWWASNPDKRKVYSKRKYWNHRAQSLARSRENVIAKRAWLARLKAELKCERCGFAHPAALAFHHQDPKAKRGIVSQLVLQGRSEAVIRAEMTKCIVLCANCHLIEHAEKRHGREREWWQRVRPNGNSQTYSQVSLLER